MGRDWYRYSREISVSIDSYMDGLSAISMHLHCIVLMKHLLKYRSTIAVQGCLENRNSHCSIPCMFLVLAAKRGIPLLDPVAMTYWIVPGDAWQTFPH